MRIRCSYSLTRFHFELVKEDLESFVFMIRGEARREGDNDVQSVHFNGVTSHLELPLYLLLQRETHLHCWIRKQPQIVLLSRCFLKSLASLCSRVYRWILTNLLILAGNREMEMREKMRNEYELKKTLNPIRSSILLGFDSS